MNQLTSKLLLSGLLLVLGGCSDDEGSDVPPKEPIAQAGTGGGGGGSAGASGSAGTGGSGGSGEMLDAGMEDLCTPVFLDAGVLATDAGTDAGDAGDAGAAVTNGAVTFTADVHPIFRANCVPCHEDEYSGGHNVAAVDVDEAYGFVDEIKDRLVNEVQSGDMPPTCTGAPGDPGCITVAELRVIQRWAAQCFPK